MESDVPEKVRSDSQWESSKVGLEATLGFGFFLFVLRSLIGFGMKSAVEGLTEHWR